MGSGAFPGEDASGEAKGRETLVPHQTERARARPKHFARGRANSCWRSRCQIRVSPFSILALGRVVLTAYRFAQRVVERHPTLPSLAAENFTARWLQWSRVARQVALQTLRCERNTSPPPRPSSV